MPACVVGMHRSGTSLVTGVLRACGLYLGEAGDLMPAADDNPVGFWENMRFVSLNEEILQANGGAWDVPPHTSCWDCGLQGRPLREKAVSVLSTFEGREPWGWKDPRTSLTVPFWRDLVPSLRFVVCLRGPLDVATSLARRNNLSLEFGVQLWTTYMERVLATVPPELRIVTATDAFFSDPERELRRLLDFLQLSPSADETAEALAVISPHLWTEALGLSTMTQVPAVSAHAIRLYRSLCAEAAWEPRPGTTAVGGEAFAGVLAGRQRDATGVGGGTDLTVGRRPGRGPVANATGGAGRRRMTTTTTGGGLSMTREQTLRAPANGNGNGNGNGKTNGHGAATATGEVARLAVADGHDEVTVVSSNGAKPIFEDLRAELDSARAELERARRKERRADERAEAARKKARTESRRNAALTTERNRAAEEAETARQETARIRAERAELRREVANVRLMEARANAEATRAKSQAEALRAALEQLQARALATTRALRATRASTRHAERDREGILSELEALRAGLTETQHEASSSRSELERSQHEIAALQEHLGWAERQLERTREELVEAHRRLLEHDQASVAPAPTAASEPPAEAGPAEYLAMVDRLRTQVGASTPERSRVAVVSRGDDRLLELGNRTASHFPCDEIGRYLGHHPGTAEEAIELMEAARASGVDYLVFPASAMWWLDYYVEFAERLAVSATEAFRDVETGVIFSLSATAVIAAPSPEPTELPDGDPAAPLLAARAAQVETLLAERDRLRNELAEAVDGAAATSRETLSRARLAAFMNSGRRLTFRPETAPVVSVVIPTYNQAHLIYQTLESLLAAAGSTPFEVVVVDNASGPETRALLSRLDNVRVQLNDRNTGFGAACGTGAHLGRGEYVCFLNSDTMVTPGWLDALIATARTWPRCGAVGAKLVHAHGRLQEAGSMIWNDGSAWAYGRGDDPSAPQYCYPREVDYCSAAALLVPRALFKDVGGFDERYAPAYYEDTDLCLAIAEAGYKVVYEPRSVVFHLEFGSSNAEKSVALQLRNRERFVEKWSHQLAQRMAPLPENVLFARDRRQALRVLVVDDRIPDGGSGSGFPRARALLHSLVGLGYAVTFMPARDRRPLDPGLSELEALGIEVLHSLDDVHATLIERSRLYDVAIVSRPHNAPLTEIIREASKRTALIYDAEAVVAIRDVLQAEVEGRYISEAERDTMIDAELEAVGGADLVLTVSEPERTLMQERGGCRAAVWGDCLPTVRSTRGFRAREDLLFVGSLATPPNADAVTHLLNDIVPELRRHCRARLLVVGANPEPRLWSAPIEATDCVLFTGFVADLAPVYESARVFVAPHRFAAGVPHKVIEAMAHGVPCVVSRLLGNQLELEQGDGVLIADTPAQFATAVAELYGNRRRWNEVQRRALQVVADRYDPAAMQDQLGGFVESALAAALERGRLLAV